MKRFYTFFLVFCSPFLCFSQALVPYLGKAGYGFCTLEGEVVIAPKYDEVTFFDKFGFADARKDGKWTLINRSGKELVPFHVEQYELLSPENRTDRFANAYTHTKLRFLKIAYIFDRENENYDINLPNSNEVNHRKDKFWVINQTTNQVKGPFLWNSIFLSHAGCYDCALDKFFSFHQNYSVCTQENGSIVTLDTLANIVLDKVKLAQSFATDTITTKPIFFQTFNDSIFIVSDTPNLWGRECTAKGKVRLLDLRSKKVLFEGKYDYFHALTPNSYSGYSINKKYELITIKNDKTVVIQSCFDIEVLNDNVLKINILGNKYKLINENQEFISKEEFDNIWFDENHSCYYFQQGKMAGILDTNLQVIIKYEADFVGYSGIPNFFKFTKNNKRGIININKQTIIPAIYDGISSFQESPNYFTVSTKTKKIGLYSTSGKILIDTVYESIEMRSVKDNIFFSANKKKECDIFDKNMQFINTSPLDFYISQEPLTKERDNSFKDYHVKIYTRFGKYTGFEGKDAFFKYTQPDSAYVCVLQIDDSTQILINQEGKPILKPNQKLTRNRYHYATINYFGITEGNNQEAVINHKGEYVLKPDNQKIINVNDAYFVVKKDKKYYIYDTRGNLKSKEGYDEINESYYSNEPRYVARHIPYKTYWDNNPCCDSETPVLKHYLNVGFIDSLGNEVIPLIYNHIPFIEDSFIFAKKGFEKGKIQSFILDFKGNVLLNSTYDDIYPIRRNSNEKELYFKVEKYKKYGLIDIGGNIIIDIKYESFNAVSLNNIFLVKENDLKKIINLKQQVIAYENELQAINNHLNYIWSTPCRLFLKEKTLLINEQGEIIFSFKAHATIEYNQHEYSKYNIVNLLKINQNQKKWYYNYVLGKAYKEPDFEP